MQVQGKHKLSLLVTVLIKFVLFTNLMFRYIFFLS